ncbi:tyrosine-type recombinase/integrase [Thalassotalea psychrophila]|uniref:Tyrosine-type recombinase/integrase n=1 Tax=Thalassotalea psychrophila TaxID=3065647 RepID=A0ABY9TUN2_9GAMM|nr:tyrosine-type recombinase/integrase [Colwelliaceae bacterium SQ149]
MKQAKTLTEREFKRVLAVATLSRHSERNCLALNLSYYAGLRVKEIAALTIGDVYSNDGTVSDFVYLDSEQTKGKQGRTIVFNKKLRALLKLNFHNMKNRNPSLPLIRSQKGKAFSANSLCQLIIALYKDASIDGASSHSGRRTFITNLAHKGVSAKVLMSLVGHSNLSTTQRYIDVNDNMLKEAVELM